MKGYRLVDFQQLGDNRGELIVAEGNKQVPFDIKRIFYIYDSDRQVIRGQHANRNSKFVFVVVKGICKILVDNGKKREEIMLDKPYQGLFLDQMIWKDMYEFSSDCILLVMASEYYNDAEYIRDYNQFLQESRR